jgi:His/Glu/Gln/Arg/opine family amino acid ABC transporter permease subunit
MDRSSRAARLLLAALLALLALTLFATPAMALTDPKVTLDQEIGGLPTRFTFVTVTDADASIPAMDIVFPKGFDLTKLTFDVVTLEGLVRSPIVSTGGASGEKFSVQFRPSLPPNATLRIQIYDVIPPNQGGTSRLKVEYSAESTGSGAPSVVQRAAETSSFSYRSPSWADFAERWLDQQPAVTKFNSIKALGMFFKPQLIVRSTPRLLLGWLYAIWLVACAFPLAIAGGLALAFMKMSKVPPARWIAAAYINVIRGTPLFLQMFVAFIGLRIGGIRSSDTVTAIAVLAVNSSAYLAEIFRAGIQSINKGQLEASSSLGMTYRQSMQYVIIPQTVKRVLPTMTSEFILLFKDTALLAALGVGEVMYGAQNIVATTGNMTPFVVGAVYYLIMTIPLINIVGKLEASLALSEHGQEPPKKRKSGFFRALAVSNDPYRAIAPEAIEPPVTRDRR